ncbi:hypothetical protein KY308_04445 [Candidatus Woesearchaeota archaeon]|nr:hypothetical protein [Candidatus Woesearchaeota archaeon]
MEKNKPEKKFRAGPITATIWKNSTEDGEREFNTVSFERGYKDKNGEWKSTNSLRVNDLPKAAMVLNKAYEYLALGNKDNSEEEVIA